jgi:hypothetical protein
MKKGTAKDSVEKQVELAIKNLFGASRKRLKETWRSLYGTVAPERMSEDHLKRAIAHRIQENAFGGLKSATRKLLDRVAHDASARRPVKSTSKSKVRTGTLLVREWHGKTHKVSVIEGGALYRGKRYSSLSEVAFHITGAHWSGPLFFGLKAAAKGTRDGAQ